MTRRFALVIACLAGVSVARGGYYSSIDTAEETRYSRDFSVFYPDVLTKLRSIRVGGLEVDFPMRRRYMLVESLVKDPTMKDHTLEQKLNYSTVLIRRGKADEAVQLLRPMANNEYATHFLVLAHCASAHFLASADEFRFNSPTYMREALKNWPKSWEEVKDDPLLKAFGWEELAFERNRRYETYFKRLIDHRITKERRNKKEKKENVEETLDPIFTDANEAPIKFVDDAGNFKPGEIPKADWDRLPRDAVEAVEQLLIWMPDDHRLLWLLGEVLNASAMEYPDQKRKNEAIMNSYAVFKTLTAFDAQTSQGVKKQAQIRFDILEEYRRKLPPPEVDLSNYLWWRTVTVVFVVGVAIGIFALWQVQEFRRRRARSARS